MHILSKVTSVHFMVLGEAVARRLILVALKAPGTQENVYLLSEMASREWWWYFRTEVYFRGCRGSKELGITWAVAVQVSGLLRAQGGCGWGAEYFWKKGNLYACLFLDTSVQHA